jgi:uncharacterized protein (TIRG00374 family)
VIKNWRIWFGGALSALALYLTLRTVDFGQVQSAMSRAAWFWFIPGAATFLAGLFFRARRWSLLMDDTPLGITWHAMLIGYMLNMSLPLRLGEVGRAWVIGQRTGVSFTRALSSIVVDRLLDLAAVLLMFAGFALVLPMPPELASAAWAGSVALVIVVIAFAVAIWQSQRVEALMRTVMKRIPGLHADRWVGRFHELCGSFRVIGNGRRLAAVLGNTALMWAFATLLAFLAQAAFMPPRLDQAGLVLVASNLGGAAPSAPGGLGLLQGAAKLALVGPFGVDENLAVAFIFVWSLSQQLSLIVLGVISLGRVGLSLKETMGAGQKTA